MTSPKLNQAKRVGPGMRRVLEFLAKNEGAYERKDGLIVKNLAKKFKVSAASVSAALSQCIAAKWVRRTGSVRRVYKIELTALSPIRPERKPKAAEPTKPAAPSPAIEAEVQPVTEAYEATLGGFDYDALAVSLLHAAAKAITTPVTGTPHEYRVVIDGLADEIKTLKEKLAAAKIEKHALDTRVGAQNAQIKTMENNIKILTDPKRRVQETPILREVREAMEAPGSRKARG